MKYKTELTIQLVLHVVPAMALIFFGNGFYGMVWSIGFLIGNALATFGEMRRTKEIFKSWRESNQYFARALGMKPDHLKVIK